MRIDEGAWAVAGGVTLEWRALRRRRAEESRRRLEKALSGAPARFRPGLAAVLAARGPGAERLLCDPALDHWLGGAGDPARRYGLFQGFAVAAALRDRRDARYRGLVDGEGHLHLYGSSYRLEFPRSRRWREAEVRVRGGRVEAAGARLARALEPAPGLRVEPCGPLMIDAVTMHGLGKFSREKLSRFSAAIGRGLGLIQAFEPELFAEMRDLVRALVPLADPERHGSVSSSYVDLRGAICLSHSEDALLQAETLIHEFCHQKMNVLLVVDPLLQDGQTALAFHSPWRPDARRLRGLLLGAHAFLNVARFLSKVLVGGVLGPREADETRTNVSRRAHEVEDALRTVSGYGELTELGRRFTLRLWRETLALHHGTLAWPPGAAEAGRRRLEDHRKRFALGSTGLHSEA